MKKIISKKIGYAVALIAFGFLFWQIINGWNDVVSFSWQFNFKNVFILPPFLFIGYFLNIYLWHLITRAFALKTSLKSNFRVWVFSSLTRFIPGKVWQYPTRIYLLNKDKLSLVVSGEAMVLEILLNLSTGSVAALLSLLFWEYSMKIYFFPIFIVFILSPLFFIISLKSQYFLKVIQYFCKLLKIDFSGKYSIKIKVNVFIKLFVVGLVRFVIYGLILFFLTRIVTPVSFRFIPVFIGAYALSWIIGYISFFAPAGLGVFCVSLVYLLSPIIPIPVVSVIAIGNRLVLLITEALFVIFWFIYLSKKDKGIH